MALNWPWVGAKGKDPGGLQLNDGRGRGRAGLPTWPGRHAYASPLRTSGWAGSAFQGQSPDQPESAVLWPLQLLPQ